MSAAPLVVPSRQVVFIETLNFYMRELTSDDATDRMASWFDQAEVRESLNVKPGRRTKVDMDAFIARFDGKNKILLGMFDKRNDLLVGFIDIDIDWKIGRYLVNMIVGEETYRNSGVTSAISPAFRTYFFGTLGLKVMTATALASNAAIAGYLKGTGWTLSQVLKGRIRSHADGTRVDLHLYSLTREAWDAWTAANPEKLRRMADNEKSTERLPKI
ncbi:MAG: GNAT family protein [Micropepsaceae bacterium]